MWAGLGTLVVNLVTKLTFKLTRPECEARHCCLPGLTSLQRPWLLQPDVPGSRCSAGGTDGPQSLHTMLWSPKPLTRALEEAVSCCSCKRCPRLAGIRAAEPDLGVLLSPLKHAPLGLGCRANPGGAQPVPWLSPHLVEGCGRPAGAPSLCTGLC